MDVTLESLTVSDRESVREIGLPEEQEAFAGSIDAVFDELTKSHHPATQHPFVVVSGGIKVGFFVLREREGLPEWGRADVITLHSFRISSSWQRKGFGRAAIGLALSWIHQNRPLASRMMLAVNARNFSARTAYIGCGFADTGRRVAGPIGELHILEINVTS